MTWGNWFHERDVSDAAGYTGPSTDLNTRSKNFTCRFHKLLGKKWVLSISHRSGLVYLTAVGQNSPILLIYTVC